MDIGARLHAAREAKRLSLDDVERLTRVKRPILAAIERNDAGSIPPRPYGRGFVRAYALEVGLDPDQTVREFFSQFAAPPDMMPPPAPDSSVRRRLPAIDPRWARPIATALVYAAAIALVVVAGHWGLERARHREAIGTSGRSAPGPASTVGTTPAPAVPASPATGLTIALEATAPSWITATADGRRILYRTLQPGEREVLHAEREIHIRAGNAGAVRWQVNGRPATLMGRAGEVRSARVTERQ